MTNEIDYQALFEQLQAENETLREKIAYLKLHGLFFSWNDILNLVFDFRYVIGLLTGIILVSLAFTTFRR